MRVLSFEPAAVTAAVDLFELYSDNTVGEGAGGEVVGIHIGQTTDLGDAAEEILPYTFRVGYTTSGGTGGTKKRGQAGGSRMPSLDGEEVLNTVVATGGTYLVSEGPVRGFNIRAGEQWDVPEGMEPYCRGFVDSTDADWGRLVVRLLAAPADSLTMFGSLHYRSRFM